MHRLAKLSLNNRSVVALATAIVAIFGFVSLGSLKQELIPSFQTPQAAVVTTYIGASPEVVDKQVSQVIENAIRQQDGLVSSTTTSQANISIVRVEFEYGTATSKVSENLAAALASVETILPSDASPKILSGSFDDVPIIALGVSANNGDNEALGPLLEDVAVPMLSGINGVRDVTLSGVTEKTHQPDSQAGCAARKRTVTAVNCHGSSVERFRGSCRHDYRLEWQHLGRGRQGRELA